jgi:hypothetical protein
MYRTEQIERVHRRVDAVGCSLDGEERHCMRHQPSVSTKLCARQNHRGPYTPVTPRQLIGGGERGLCTVRLSGDSDSGGVDKALERTVWRSASGEEPPDDEAHIPGLVHDVALVGSAGRVRVAKRE